MGGISSQGGLLASGIAVSFTSVAGNFASEWISIPPVLPTQISFGLTSAGAYTVQFKIGTSAAFDHAFVANVTGDQTGNFAFPISAVRVLVIDPATVVTGAFNIAGALPRTITEVQ